MIPRLSVSIAPIRAGTWWAYKTPLLLAALYAAALAGGVPFARVWPAALACVAALVPLASYVCVVNDITDERDDLRAGKSNRMAGKTVAFKAAWLTACLVGGLVAGVTCFRGHPAAAGLYVANWVAFTLYSVPPIRLKSRGLAGVLADASGGQLLPSLWSVLLVDPAPTPVFLAAVAAWSAAFGLRGILYHQAGDIDCDRASGVGTLAVRMGAQRVGTVVAMAVLPVELTALGVILWMSDSRYTAPALAVYGILQAVMWVCYRVRTVIVLPRGSHRLAMLEYYRLWFPLTGLLALADADSRASGAIVAHLVMFPGTWWRFPWCCYDIARRLARAVWNRKAATSAPSRHRQPSAAPPREAPHCDLHWAGSAPDAHARYAKARSLSPVCFDPGQHCWCILGYDAAVDCLGDPATFSSDPNAEFDPCVDGGDPPDHGRYRRMLQDSMREFDRAAVVSFTSEWLDRFFDRRAAGAEFDAVADLAVPLVDDLAGRMVGLRPEEVARFASLRPGNRTHVRSFDEVAWDFFMDVLRRDRSPRPDGAIGFLAEKHANGELSERQAVSMLRLLWIGATATSNLFTPSVLMLLARHADVQRRLRADPGLVPSFVSEALRLESPTTVIPRRVTADCDFYGQRLRADDLVNVCLLAANSDPTAFPAPERIDLERPAGRHIAFGFGIHFCLGAIVARSLAETVVEKALRAMPSLQLAENLDRLVYEPGNLRGLSRLRMRVPSQRPQRRGSAFSYRDVAGRIVKAMRTRNGASDAVASPPRPSAPPPRDAPICRLRWAGSEPDAHARYAAARRLGPVCFDPVQSCWNILSYDAAVACLGDPRRFRGDPVAAFDPLVLAEDAPQQGNLRRVLQESLRDFDKPTVASYATTWLDHFRGRLAQGGNFDAVADLAVPLVDDLAGRMVGLTPEEVATLANSRPANRTDVHGSDTEAWNFFTRLLADCGPTRRSGALRVILEHRHRGTLTERQAVGLARVLWIGATATTNLLVSSAVMLLVRHPDIQGRLRVQPALVPPFIAEVLRLESPSAIITRTVAEPGDFFGQHLRADDIVKVCILAANSDPTAFPSPERIDLDRPSGRHVAFGYGVHYCLGATMARSLAETAITDLLRFLPPLHPVEDLDRLEYEEGDLRGLKRLRVRVS